MYRGYPVGYFLFWQTGAEGVETKVIGDANKQKAPSLLIVDGQQRLTSLYAVIRREAVLRENFEREHIRIAFRPQSGTFAVPDATTERDPEYKGVESVRDINQIANYTLVEWDDNIGISDAPPSQYWPRYAERFDPETLAAMMRWHALPQDWWTLSYEDFLVARRPLIADVIRQGYAKLSGGA